MYEASDKKLLEALGGAVRERRLTLNLSQEYLAELAGLHRTYVADVERGSRNLGFINLVRLAEALDMTLAELVACIPRAKGGKAGKAKIVKAIHARRKV